MVGNPIFYTDYIPAKWQAKKLVELEAEVRGLTAKAQHAQEEEKGKWAELAREKAAVATGARRVAELEAQVASLNDMVELLSLDKEQLLLDQELLVGGWVGPWVGGGGKCLLNLQVGLIWA